MKWTRWATIVLGLLAVTLMAADCQQTGSTEGQAQASNQESDSGNASGFDEPEVEHDDGIGGDTPGVLYSKKWPGLLNDENYDLILSQTEEVIALGPNTKHYAEARLYHGLALLSLDEEPRKASEDLMVAERLKADLGDNKDLLLVGQVLVFEKLGETVKAERYRQRAVQEIQNTELIQQIQRQNLQIQPAKLIINDQLQLKEFRQQE